MTTVKLKTAAGPRLLELPEENAEGLIKLGVAERTDEVITPKMRQKSAEAAARFAQAEQKAVDAMWEAVGGEETLRRVTWHVYQHGSVTPAEVRKLIDAGGDA